MSKLSHSYIKDITMVQYLTSPSREVFRCWSAAVTSSGALGLALRFLGRKRVHNSDEIMAEIVAKRLVEHLERAGFVVMKPPGWRRCGPSARF
jgi:hypothetical protein